MLVLPRYVDELSPEFTREPPHILEQEIYIRLVFQDNHLGFQQAESGTGNLERRKLFRKLQSCPDNS